MHHLHPKIGSEHWNDLMFSKYPTPSRGIVGFLKWSLAATICRLIRKYETRDSFSLLEVGCESGYLLQFLSKKFPRARLTGIDISNSALEIAKNRVNRNIQLFHHDLVTTPPHVATAPFDVLVCSETLEHIPEVEKAVENLAAIAGDQAIVIVTVPKQNVANLAKKMLAKMKLFELLAPGLAPGTCEWHVQCFNRKTLECFLKEAFEIRYYQRAPFHHIFVAKKRDRLPDSSPFFLKRSCN
jgi:2-polyprenyl-3-methyl-5-hydroxy-6-metoxy-1,4-benzoquinol methylase